MMRVIHILSPNIFKIYLNINNKLNILFLNIKIYKLVKTKIYLNNLFIEKKI